MTIAIAPLRAEDRSQWEALARAYKDFYRETTADEDYERTWQRLLAGEAVHGLVACLDDRLVGFAHYLFHDHCWAGRVCYLQDLFTAPDSRGRGVARALIDAVADAARAGGARRYYWLTQDDNATARALYDRIAHHHGFIRYDYPL